MQLTLDGKTKDQVAIEFIETWNTDIPMYGGFSGGLDSQIIYDLAERAKANVDWVYNFSPIDPKITHKFIKEKYPKVRFENHTQKFFTSIFMKHGLPLRTQRWCCEYIKECGGIGKVKLLGMRSEESNGRSNYCFVMDASKQGKGTMWILPILDWTDEDRKQYMLERNIKPNPLYSMGFHRTGCVLCPNQTELDIKLSIQYFPEIVRAWRKAANEYIQLRWDKWNKYESLSQEERELIKGRKPIKPTYKTGEEYFNWWIKRH